MKVDILAIGAHPDDIELCCGGTVIACVKQGKSVAILDLTQGELGTRGTPETRREEATAAAEVMQIVARENLGLSDGFFQIEENTLRKVIEKIRKYQPDIVLCNAIEDRHPDHGRAAKLVSRACFLSGLRKIETSEHERSQTAWRPQQVFHYIQDSYIEPDFVFDITDYHEQKMEAIFCYKTQFNTTPDDEPQTYISTPHFMQTVISREIEMGKKIGVPYGEGFVTEKKIGIRNFDNLYFA